MREKERELNERLQDVTGKLGSAKKIRKGKNWFFLYNVHSILSFKPHDANQQSLFDGFNARCG